MRRGAKPAKAKAEAKPPVARKSLKSADSRVGDLEKQLAEALEREAGAVKREAEARDQQTATSEILSVISRSQTDVQPVFDAIVQSALGLCGADRGTVYRFDGELIHIAAQAGYSEEQMALYRRIFPLAASMQTALGKSVLTRRTVHVEDTLTERRYTSDTEAIRVAREVLGYRTVLAVPMVHRDQALGIISVTRREQLPFSPKQIALVETFADQAVIAVENVRLFNETKEALEQQTATAEILRVISSSPTDYQPVFDAIVRTAGLVCGAVDALLWTTDGDELVVRAHHGPLPATIGARQPMHGSVAGYAVRQARVVHVKDLTEADDFPVGRDLARRLGWRTTLSAPLLGEGVAIGAILIRRSEVRPFSDQQIALLQTFADQAVIAIENVRLFKELDEKNRALTEALEQQTATAEILRVIASSPTDVRPVFEAILKRAATLCEAQLGHLWLYEGGEQFRLGAGYGSRPDHLQWLQQGLHRFGRPFFRESGPWRVGQVLDVRDTEPYRRGEPVWIRTADHEGMRTLLAVPLVKDGRLVGSIAVYRREVQPFTDQQTALVQTFADQAVIAIENVRLFKELEVANRELEAASRHKSEFLANMSHELRTPLNAIIGFSEVLTERMFGELNEKQDEYLKDIYASGQHLLSLINDILDLSKIEAGRMELEVVDFDLPSAIDNALILVRERASRRGITLGHSVDERLGQIRGDERKVKQVLLNLLSNALKFTPEGGRIDVSAQAHDGVAEIAVTDTGVGIAPEDQEAVFEEFRQVGTADKKVEGTGLGLALSRKFIELHGGRIWVQSQVGQGSTFTFTLPVR